jgi:hypothetical protein
MQALRPRIKPTQTLFQSWDRMIFTPKHQKKTLLLSAGFYVRLFVKTMPFTEEAAGGTITNRGLIFFRRIKLITLFCVSIHQSKNSLSGCCVMISNQSHFVSLLI